MIASQGGYSSAKIVLSCELFFATLRKCTAMFAEPLPEGGNGLGGHEGAGKSPCEIHTGHRETTLASWRGSLTRLCGVGDISG